jgi:hypothetical protein
VCVETTPLLRWRRSAKVILRDTHTHTTEKTTKCTRTTPLRFWSVLRKTRHGIDDTNVVFRNTRTEIQRLDRTTLKRNLPPPPPPPRIALSGKFASDDDNDAAAKHCTLKPILVRTLRENVSDTNTAYVLFVYEHSIQLCCRCGTQ